MGWERLPRSRAEAMVAGSNKYYTGKPCKHGHLAPRYLSGHCVECDRIRERRRRARNPVAARERERQWRANNPEYIRRRSKRQREAARLWEALVTSRYSILPEVKRAILSVERDVLGQPSSADSIAPQRG